MKALVLIPTYNERENLPLLVHELLGVSEARVMVIDDQSPDGTGAIADALAAEHPARVQVLHRTGPRGLGVSYVDGFRRAVATDADVICMMDADRSHDPRHLPDLLAASASADLVIGSRYLNGISVVNWPLHRIMLSTGANFYIRTVTGLAVRDCTTGYRCWRREALARLPLDRIVSEGYSFLVEITFLAARAGMRIVERPIIFVERREGASKLSGVVLMESLIMPWTLIARHGRLRSPGRGSSEYNSPGPSR